MSRIGNAPVAIPAGVDIAVNDAVVTVKGPKGELTQAIDASITVKIEDGNVVCERSSNLKDVRAKHGRYRSLINNMVIGVTDGYKKEMELVGVGYRASSQGQNLELVLGFSHSVVFQLPNEIKIATQSERGKNPLITLESHDKQLIGQVCAKIRSLRPPEPYKGKGIKYKDEYIFRKEGKKK